MDFECGINHENISIRKTLHETIRLKISLFHKRSKTMKKLFYINDSVFNWYFGIQQKWGDFERLNHSSVVLTRRNFCIWMKKGLKVFVPINFQIVFSLLTKFEKLTCWDIFCIKIRVRNWNWQFISSWNRKIWISQCGIKKLISINFHQKLWLFIEYSHEIKWGFDLFFTWTENMHGARKSL